MLRRMWHGSHQLSGYGRALPALALIGLAWMWALPAAAQPHVQPSTQPRAQPNAQPPPAPIDSAPLAAPENPAPAAPAPAEPVPISREDAAASGAYYYARRCAGCHGADGRGTPIGFPLVGRPAGPLGTNTLIEALRFPLQNMPRFGRDVISDDVARLIGFHLAILENAASGAPVPAPPQVDAAALRVAPSLPPPPEVAPAPAGSYELREFESPCGAGADSAIAPDGRVWFAGIARNVLAQFNPRTGEFRCHPLLTRNGRPHGVAVDRDGFVFVTLTGLPDNKVAMFDARSELFVEYQMPARPQPLVYPSALAFDNERNALTTFEYGDAIGRIDRRTGAVTSLPLPTRHARPTGIAIARNGHVLAAEFTGNRILDYDPKTGRTVEHVHPRASEDPGLRALAIDSKGNVWVAEHEFGSIGVFEPRTQRWKSFRAPANGGTARGVAAIAVDARDGIWFSHHGGNYIGRFDPRTETFSVYPHQSRDVACLSLDIAKDGALWCMGSGAAVLTRLAVK